MGLPALTLDEPLQLTDDKLDELALSLLHLPQVDCPLVHRFAPGVYLREILMPAGTFVIGHLHKTEHFNIVLRGRAIVMIDGETQEIVGPCTFVSGPGVRKVLYIKEDMVWQTIHPTHETNMARLEEDLIVKSGAYEAHLEDLRSLRQLVNEGSS